MDQVVILARGLGTRMRKSDPAVALDPTLAAAADSGVKAMIPIGRPFWTMSWAWRPMRALRGPA